MSMISVSHLTFSYDGSADKVFDDISFKIDSDWKLGFTGRNGKGKTTFLNLLMQKYPYEGTIHSDEQFEYFPFQITDGQKTSEQVIHAYIGEYADWELTREISKLDLNEDVLQQPFGTLSKGQQTKLMIAALFIKDNRFLLIDEPTNHLDARGRQLLGRYLRTKKGFILVSHDRTLLDECTDHTLSINRTGIEIQKGSFSSWYENKIQKDESELAANQKLKAEIRRLKNSAAEKADWSDRVEATKIGYGPCDRGAIGHKAAKMMKRSKNIEKRKLDAISEKSKLLKNIEETENLKLTQLEFRGNRMILLSDVSIAYGDRTACSHITFEVCPGDRIALNGSNGSGKSSVMKLICGDSIQHTGIFERNPSLMISYVPQDVSFLKGTLDEYAEEKKIDISLFKAILRKLDFTREQFGRNIENYSEGQKKKVLIAGSLCERAHLLIWDEPLNYIDVFSRIQIEKLLNEYRPTILFAEHDARFCEKIATEMVNMGD